MDSFLIHMVSSGFLRERKKNKELDADLRIQVVCGLTSFVLKSLGESSGILFDYFFEMFTLMNTLTTCGSVALSILVANPRDPC
jgi:hypothetical protein